MSNQLINGIPQVDNGFQSLGEVLQRASRETRRDEKGNDKGNAKRIELKVTLKHLKAIIKQKQSLQANYVNFSLTVLVTSLQTM